MIKSKNLLRTPLLMLLPAIVLSLIVFAKCKKVEAPVLYHYPAADTISYEESTEDFANPERGFYTYSETSASNYSPLDVATLKNARMQEQQASNGQYKIYSTLTFRYYILTGFNNKPLTDDLLNKIKTDFDVARQAGVKLIPRFTYTVKTQAGNCPEGFACPPYGDAPKEIVLQHIAQLKPILTANADVIACVQLGFIGIWGENYYTDYFGDPSSNGQGKLLDENWKDRAEVLKALLDALPTDRMVQVRYPQMKQRFVYGINAGTDAAALTDAQGFTGSYQARIGLHNDCFISSASDYGTYDNYGNSSTPRDNATAALRDFSSADNKYVAVGGETCDESYSPQNNCESAGIIQTELNRMHYSYLNSAYNNSVNNIWVSGGCMENIKKNLGYRLVLKNTIIPKAAIKAGTQLPLIINLKNTGYASPFNPRVAKLILRGQDGKEFSYDLSTKVQEWFTGDIKINEMVLLDAAMPSGKYDLYLYLPDKYESISKRPEYAIRLANKDVWDATTGYNNLKISVQVN